jgi:hypothetical protein
MSGAKFVLKSFVHAARKTRDRVLHPHLTYDSRQCPFQGARHPLFLEMTDKVVEAGLFRPMDKPTQIEECRPE